MKDLRDAIFNLVKTEDRSIYLWDFNVGHTYAQVRFDFLVDVLSIDRCASLC